MAAQISPLPSVPSRQDPINFNDRADAFLGALPTFATQTNTVAAEVNAAAGATLAATNITKWVSGTTYENGAVVWSPINGLGYRRITASGSGTTDPSLDTTNYKQVNGTGDVSTSGNQTISGVKVFNDNLGIGMTPSAWQSTLKGIDVAQDAFISGTNAVNVLTNAYKNSNGSWVYKSDGPATLFSNYNGAFTWNTSPSDTAGNPITFTQAMTLDASGNLLVGTTSAGANNTNSVQINKEIGAIGIQHLSGTPHTSVYLQLNYAGGGIGSITQSGTTGVSYNTSSDYRLKHDIAPMQGAMTRIAALKPVTYKWDADGSDGEGFIAHELAEVCPSAVTGEKDAVDADGKPIYQGIDTSFLVATLVAAIQEQQLMITNLTSRIEVLESALPN